MKIRLYYKIVQWLDGGDFRGETIHEWTDQFDEFKSTEQARDRIMEIVADDETTTPESWQRWGEPKPSTTKLGLIFESRRSSPVYVEKDGKRGRRNIYAFIVYWKDNPEKDISL